MYIFFKDVFILMLNCVSFFGYDGDEFCKSTFGARKVCMRSFVNCVV